MILILLYQNSRFINIILEVNKILLFEIKLYQIFNNIKK